MSELSNISESQVVSNDLYKRVSETTPAEGLARNPLILEHLSTLLRSNKKAFSLLKALLAKFASSGGRIRTDDLEVMSLASYRAAPPRDRFILRENKR